MGGKTMGGNVAEKVRQMAQPLCDAQGVFLWDVRFEKEGASWYLRVFIDKDGGVDIDDCEAVSRPLSDLLDESDPIPQSYVLEVGSPGLARELRRPEHFQCCIGDEIKVRLIRPDENSGEKELIGALSGFEKNIIYMKRTDNGSDIELPLSSCAYVRLHDDEDLFADTE